ncbi:MAG: HK97 family phage prohead protease [Phycisphaerales bacterium]|jgi:HK97 family phage prohead protease
MARLLRKTDDGREVYASQPMTLIRKEIDVTEGIYEVDITAEIIDRDEDIVRATGAMLENYNKNPVVLFAHDYRQPPVAKTLKIEVLKDQGLRARFQFPREGVSSRADEIRLLWGEGFLNAASIGFVPIESQDVEGKAGRDFTKWELLEWSIVTVPANPEALRRALGAMDDETVLSPEGKSYAADDYYFVLPREEKFAGSPKNRFGTHSSYKFKGNYAAAWRCHFSKVGGGGTSGAASGPIRGTVRRCEMIAATMKPSCSLPSTDSIGPRQGPKSPLQCSFPSGPGDYGLSSWAEPETDADREGMKLSCSDLAVIKRAALAEIKRRANDRENQSATVDDRPTLNDVDITDRIEPTDELTDDDWNVIAEALLPIIIDLQEVLTNE